jgi:RnfABCDGE-type electron transport complex B subunit
MLPPIIILGSLGLLFGVGLYVASKVFHVDIDPRVSQICSALPGANCGACGLAGCSGLAKAIVHGSAAVDACLPGGEEVVELIADIMGVEATTKDKEIAVLRCNGKDVKNRFDYQGIPTCAAANNTQGGHKKCTYGCLMYGDCDLACPFDAIQMVNDFPVVDEVKCTGCGNCVTACPRDLYFLKSLTKLVHVLCMSKAKAKDTMQACKVGCIGCKKCEKECKFDAIYIADFLSTIEYDKCTSCGACVRVCPTNSIINLRKERKEKGLWPVKKAKVEGSEN